MDSINVLVIEDNRDHAAMLKFELQSRKEAYYTVECVASLGEAITRLKQGGIEAVTLDLTLGDASGMGVIEQVAQVAKYVGIVVLTGLDVQEREVKEHGADVLLHKPTRAEELSLSIRYSIAHKRDAKRRHALEDTFADIGSLMRELGELDKEKK